MGEEKLTSSDTLNRYKIGTSGNVKRIREALESKEIVDTTSGKLQIADPLFKIWLEEFYFTI